MMEEIYFIYVFDKKIYFIYMHFTDLTSRLSLLLSRVKVILQSRVKVISPFNKLIVVRCRIIFTNNTKMKKETKKETIIESHVNL